MKNYEKPYLNLIYKWHLSDVLTASLLDKDNDGGDIMWDNL